METAIGVDLVYWNRRLDAWTLVQYKATQSDDTRTYSPDETFLEQIEKMRRFRTSFPDEREGGGVGEYRLCGDGFFFKFCSRVQLEVSSGSLLPGKYFPRLLIERILTAAEVSGVPPRISLSHADRHLSNTDFAVLVRDGWVGTRTVTSARIAAIVKELLDAGHSVTLAKSGAAGDGSSLEATIADLGFASPEGAR